VHTVVIHRVLLKIAQVEFCKEHWRLVRNLLEKCVQYLKIFTLYSEGG
jgi:hypothetical protein